MKKFSVLILKSSIVLFITSIVFLSPVFGANHALLVGVGEYKHSKINLPGIDKDINMITKAAKIMGFKNDQIKILKDSDASLKNITNAINDWLIKSVEENDRVLFYFSGHGSQMWDQSGDEADNVDEVLLPYDMEVKKHSLDNVLSDDVLSRLLAKIPAQDVMVLIDACHSGSASKSLDLIEDEFPKVFQYSGMPVFIPKAIPLPEPVASVNYVGLSACRDDELSLATGSGSLFTQGVLSAVNKASKSKQALNFNDLKAQTEAFITKKVSTPSKAHHPQISGDPDMANADIFTTKNRQRFNKPDIWKSLEKIADRASYPVNVRTNKTSFEMDEFLKITCDIKDKGYLNVINVSPGDTQATVLFPNKYHPENKVKAGSVITIPNPEDKFKLKAIPPAGKSFLAVFHTAKDINTYRDGIGSMDSLFKTMSTKSLRGFQVIEDKKEEPFGAGKVVTYIKK
ncbi:caspase family protein [Desulfobacterales bacterium HSG17]|nr:caspase family protein [Desulfobacterales bacterium HSG17]